MRFCWAKASSSPSPRLQSYDVTYEREEVTRFLAGEQRGLFPGIEAWCETVRAGEDVRVIPVRDGDWPAGLPHFDYWLFDSSVLVAMRYDDAGAFVEGEVIDEPGRIVEGNYWRDLAVSRSVPYRDYASRLRLAVDD
jgi:hypothetical protein